MKINYSLSLEGEACPYPAITTLDTLDELKGGEILEVPYDCSQNIHSVPNDAENRSPKVLEIDQDGPTLRSLI